MNNRINIDAKNVLFKLIVNDVLVQVSGAIGIFLLFLVLDFYKPLYLFLLIFYSSLIIFPFFLIDKYFLLKKVKNNIEVISNLEYSDVRELVSNLKLLTELPGEFYKRSLVYWLLGGTAFIFVLNYLVGEPDVFKTFVQIISIYGLAPVVAIASQVIIKRIIGKHIKELFESIDEEIHLNFLKQDPDSVFGIYILNFVYITFYIVFFLSIINVSITAKIIKKNLSHILSKYYKEIEDTINGFYFSNISPEDLDIYLKTKQMVGGAKLSFVQSDGKLFGYPLPKKISPNDLLIVRNVKNYGKLYIYAKISTYDLFKQIITRGMLFFFIFILFLGYVFFVQLGKELDKEVKIVYKNVDKIAKFDLIKLFPLYSTDEFSAIYGKLIEVKKNFSYLFSKMNFYVSKINENVRLLLSDFDSFLILANEQTETIKSTKSQLDFLDDFVTSVTSVTVRLSQIAEDFSDVIVKFVASVNEARDETHKLLKITESIASSVTEINVTQTDLDAHMDFAIGLANRIDVSLDKMLELYRELSTEISSLIKMGVSLSNINKRELDFINSGRQKLTKFREFYESILNKIDVQSDETAKINDILKIIDDLIDQTNVLALNASLIAAKSGTEDSGFGVIAESIKDLSERLHISMSEMSSIISSNQNGLKTIKELGINSKKELSSIESDLEKAQKFSDTSLKDIEVMTRVFDNVFTIMDSGKVTATDMLEDIRNVRNFLDSMAYDLKEQKKLTDRIFEHSIDLKDIVDVVKVSYEQLSESTSTFTFTYDKMRTLSGDLRESIVRFKSRVESISDLLKEVDRTSSGIKDVLIKIEFALYGLNKFMISLNSYFAKFKIQQTDISSENE